MADAAHRRGAFVVAITASHSPLARKADVALIVDHLEDVNTHVPMVSRILHLLVIDILAVGVAMRRGTDAAVALTDQTTEALDEAQSAPRSRTARRAGLGVHTSGPLADLTSHSR